MSSRTCCCVSRCARLACLPASKLHTVGEDERAALHVGLGLTLNHGPLRLIQHKLAETGLLKQQGWQV